MSKIVSFAGKTVDSALVNRPNPRKRLTVWPNSWTRVEITVPNDYEAPTLIEEWINTNLSYGYGWHTYTSSTRTHSYETGHRMVLGFERQSDAMMFKLRNGYKAYETTESQM